MKSTAIAAIVSLMMVAVLTRPAEAKSNTEYGIKIGLASSKVVGDVKDVLYSDMKARLGASLGGFAMIPFVRNIYIQPEVCYTVKGARSATDDNGAVRLTYLEFPVLLKLMAVTHGPAQPFLTIGPAVGFLLSSEYEFGNLDADLMSITLKMDGSLVIGGGLHMPYGKRKFVMDGRYMAGFIDIYDDKGHPIPPNRKLAIKNRSVVITLGYAF